jgi:hypothetical protein
MIEASSGRPGDLADDLEKDLAEAAELSRRRYDAEIALSNAIAGGQIRTADAPQLRPYTAFERGTIRYRKSEVFALWPEVAGPPACSAGAGAQREPSRPIEPKPLHRKRGGGPREQYDWARVEGQLQKRLEEDGFLADGDGNQAGLERFVLSLFPSDAAPAESLIRKHVKKTIEAYRASLEP